MTRTELEHIIRAAGAIADVEEVVILGSQSILGQFPELSDMLATDSVPMTDARSVLFRSAEADVLVLGSKEKTETIEGAIGELSVFHRTFGYYAHGVDVESSVLPEGWMRRLVEIRNENTHGIAGLCLEVHDLVISKLHAGREKDIEFVQTAARLGLLSKQVLMERLAATKTRNTGAELVKARIERSFNI